MQRQRFTLLVLSSALLLAGGTLMGCTTTAPDGRTAPASTHGAIDTQADATLERLYAQVPGARQIGATAKGILIFPAVVGGSFVVGAEYGRGVLLPATGPRSYYGVVVGSFGWQVGAQSKAIAYMFTTTESLERFRRSKGWTAGVDATVALANVGANGSIDTNTMHQPVVGFVLANAGLEVGASLQGMKISELDS